MRKITGVLALLICIAVMLGACVYTPVKLDGKADLSYAATSNGGTAVQLGKYVYFINGIKPIDDTEGANNVWGKVQKGGIYRIEMIDGVDKNVTDAYGTYKTFVNSEAAEGKFIDSEDYTGFKMITVKDYEDEDTAFVKSELVVPKLVTGGGYKDGGLFIIDGWMYYCSPNNQKDKKGEIQYNLTDFFRTRVDGSGTQRIYTTKTPSSTISYGYYYIDKTTYLCVFEDTTITSVEMTGGRVKNAKIIAEDVTGALFPKKDVSYSGMADGGNMDYIYYTRAATKDDKEQTGNVVVRMRPSGDTAKRVILFNGGSNISLHSMKDGILFYTETQVSATKLYACDLAGFLESFDDPAEAARESVFVEVISSTASLSEINVFVEWTGAHPSFYAIAVRGARTVRIDARDASEKILADTGARILAKDGNTVYYSSPGLETANLNKFDLSQPSHSVIEVIKEVIVTQAFFNLDICAGRLFYIRPTINVIGYEDQAASNYMHIIRTTANTGEKEFLVGQYDDADIPEEEDEE